MIVVYIVLWMLTNNMIWGWLKNGKCEKEQLKNMVTEDGHYQESPFLRQTHITGKQGDGNPIFPIDFDIFPVCSVDFQYFP